jgi:CcmD family protein
MDTTLIIVLITSLIVWFGLFGYLSRLDRRLRDLEDRE